MSQNSGTRLPNRLGEDKGTETKSITSLAKSGEITCIVVYPDENHVKYINHILNPIKELLPQKRFRYYLLSDETLPDKHFGKTFEELTEECVLGIVCLDGLRPNVIYEYGILKGKNKPIIPIQDKTASVAIKSYYRIPEYTDKIIKSITGLTRLQFESLDDPPIGYYDHLSDLGGIRSVVVDCSASLDSSDHPKIKLEEELEKLMPNIAEEYSKLILKPISRFKPKIYQKFYNIVHCITEYYVGIKTYSAKDIEDAIDEIKELESNSGINIRLSVNNIIGSLYMSLAERMDWKNVKQRTDCYYKAQAIFEEI